VKLAEFLRTVAPKLLCLEKALAIGATERGASRLSAGRMPEAVVNARRKIAKKHAQPKGYTPSQAHLTLMAWNLFITNVPYTIWKSDTVVNVYPLRWQIDRIFTSWKSDLHFASLTTTKEDTTLCSLYGRLLLIVLKDALSPQIRAHLWMQKKRELSLLKLMRHGQAFAARWMQAILQSELAFRRFLTHLCATAERLAAKASRKRRTTAQIRRENLRQQHESVVFAEAVNA
jgi:hypothetical protein